MGCTSSYDVVCFPSLITANDLSSSTSQAKDSRNVYHFPLIVPDHAGDWITKVTQRSLVPCKAAVSCKSGHSQLATYNWLPGATEVTSRMLYLPGI